MKIKLYGDGATIEDMVQSAKSGIVKGLTTNPTLMAKSGIRDYAAFAKDVLKQITDIPISFEVFSDELVEMEREATIINTWGSNVNIKIPITNSQGQSTIPLIKKLSQQGLSLNITALFTMEQLKEVKAAIDPKASSIISIFAGRIADTGRDPMDIMKQAVSLFADNKKAEILWASTREVFNIFQAEQCGAHIVTVPFDLIKKLPMVGKDLTELSLATVQMFRTDAVKSGFSI